MIYKTEMIKLEFIKVYPTRFPPTFVSSDTMKMWTVDEFLDSIKKNGVLVPVQLRYLKCGYYDIVDGKHRVAVARRMGMKEIPAQVIDSE